MKPLIESGQFLKSYGLIAFIVIKILFLNKSEALEITHLVKKSETMSGILYRYGEKKIYGTNGSLVKNLALNPTIKGNGNFILPNMVIKLSINEPELEKRSSSFNSKSTFGDVDLNYTEEVTKEVSFGMNIKRNAHHTIKVFPKYSFFKIDSDSKVNSSSAVLLSEPSIGIDLRLEQAWSNKFLTGFLGSYQNVTFNNSSEGVIRKASSQSVSGISFYSSYLIPGKISLITGGGYSNQLVAKSLSSGVATVNSVEQFSAGIGLKRNVFNYRDIDFDVSAEYKKFFDAKSGKVSVRNSNGYILGFNLKKSIGRVNLWTEFSYFDLATDTTTSKQRVQSFNSLAGISWGFPE